jgi:hypothetical protein
MSNPRGYSRGTITALAVLGQGTCYWPNPLCLVPATVRINGHHVFNLEIAHIRAARKGGPRYVETMSNDQRRAFNNLIFLCTPHHLIIDKIEPHKYPIDTLQQWKDDREKGTVAAALKSIPQLTEDHVQSDIPQALEEQIKNVRDAINELSRINSEAADILRGIADKLDQPSLNSGLIEELGMAAQMLEHRLTEENVTMLYNAAQRLSNLPPGMFDM